MSPRNLFFTFYTSLGLTSTVTFVYNGLSSTRCILYFKEFSPSVLIRSLELLSFSNLEMHGHLACEFTTRKCKLNGKHYIHCVNVPLWISLGAFVKYFNHFVPSHTHTWSCQFKSLCSYPSRRNVDIQFKYSLSLSVMFLL